MSNLQFKIQNFIQKRKTLLYLILFFVIFIVTIYLDKIAGLIIKIFPGSSYPGMVSISDRILFITFIILILYTWETFGMKKEMVKQTKLEQMPIMLLYIRDYTDYVKSAFIKKEKVDRNTPFYIKNKFNEYLITFKNESGKVVTSNYYLSLRNTGHGTAFNISVKGENFKVEKYKCKFFASLGDEHPIKIVKKDNKEMIKLTELNGEIFIIRCESIIHKKYSFRYKIVDIKKKGVKFLRN